MSTSKSEPNGSQTVEWLDVAITVVEGALALLHAYRRAKIREAIHTAGNGGTEKLPDERWWPLRP